MKFLVPSQREIRDLLLKVTLCDGEGDMNFSWNMALMQIESEKHEMSLSLALLFCRAVPIVRDRYRLWRSGDTLSDDTVNEKRRLEVTVVRRPKYV